MTAPRRRQWGRRLGWFIALWIAGVGVVAIVGLLIRAVLL